MTSPAGPPGRRLALEPVAKTGALLPDGRTRPFDASANGFVRAKACGAVGLKRLSDCVRDRDQVHALIMGSADSQARLIFALLADLGLTGDDIAYHETHGTGTPLGDPIEMAAIVRAIRGAAPSRELLVGSVKANLGHTESAAGVMGLIKATMCLERSRARGDPAPRSGGGTALAVGHGPAIGDVDSDVSVEAFQSRDPWEEKVDSYPSGARS